MNPRLCGDIDSYVCYPPPPCSAVRERVKVDISSKDWEWNRRCPDCGKFSGVASQFVGHSCQGTTVNEEGKRARRVHVFATLGKLDLLEQLLTGESKDVVTVTELLPQPVHHQLEDSSSDVATSLSNASLLQPHQQQVEPMQLDDELQFLDSDQLPPPPPPAFQPLQWEHSGDGYAVDADLAGWQQDADFPFFSFGVHLFPVEPSSPCDLDSNNVFEPL